MNSMGFAAMSGNRSNAREPNQCAVDSDNALNRVVGRVERIQLPVNGFDGGFESSHRQKADVGIAGPCRNDALMHEVLLL